MLLDSAPPMPTRHLTLRFRRTLLAIVLLALGLAQTLGLLHRVVHAPHAKPGVHALAVAVGSVAAASGSWLKAMFAGHDSAQGCDLYDQMSHADLACAASPVVAAAVPAPVGFQFHPAWFIAAEAAGFLARGPPARG